MEKMEIQQYKAVLTLESGLHIGSSDDPMKIGGIDSPVIKREVRVDENGAVSGNRDDVKIKEPYIPGSSLKGKIRSLLELHYGVTDGEPANLDEPKGIGSDEDRDKIVRLFGQIGNAEKTPKNAGITRGLFRDAYITEEYRKLAREKKIELFEAKMENVIDRKTGTTKNGGLRTIERVPSGIQFDINFSLRYFGDEKEELEKLLWKGVELLNSDALGGSGSRGYGSVSIELSKV
jgi:CRISPR-associated protein Csm3